MKLFYVFPVALLLTVFPAIFGSPIQSAESSQYLAYLDDLDDFSLMNIFDQLGLNDLSKLVLMNPRFRQLITDHYIIGKYHLHDRLIYIDNHVEIKMYSQEFGTVDQIANSYDEILSILEGFGELFKQLKIILNPNGYNHWNGIQRLINKHCSKAFQEVQLIVGYANSKYVDSNGIDLFANISFLNATNITLDRRGADDIPPIQLDTAFPRMEKLTTNSVTDLNHHYPYLNETILDLQTYYPDPHISTFFEFIRLNPQMRSIGLPVLNNETYLKTMSEFLPNLESLSLRLSEVLLVRPLPVAQFKHVKHFTLADGRVQAILWNQKDIRPTLKSLQFDILESFTVAQRIHPAATNFVVDLIIKNTALQNVSIDSELDIGQLSRLIQPLHKLKELSIACNEKLTTVQHFLEHVVASGHGLTKFTVKLPENGVLHYTHLLDLIPNGWGYNKDVSNQNQQWLQLERLQ